MLVVALLSLYGLSRRTFWTVHQRLADTKPTTDLCRIGTTTVVRKLITLYHQRRGKYRGTVSLESLRDR